MYSECYGVSNHVFISLQVDSEWNSGNHQGAYDAARMARNWGIVGIVTGVIVPIVLVIVFIAITVAVASGSTTSDDTEYN